jgi:Uma2 family endonuclease
MYGNSTTGWTYSEYARLPADRRNEVAKGEVIGTPSPSPFHQLVLGAVLGAIYRLAQRSGEVFLGPVDVLFGEGDYLVPDLVWIRRERIGIISDRGIEGAPDLIVEVASPATADRDRGIKRERYANYGVPHYWIVDPRRRDVEVYRGARRSDRAAGRRPRVVHVDAHSWRADARGGRSRVVQRIGWTDEWAAGMTRPVRSLLMPRLLVAVLAAAGFLAAARPLAAQTAADTIELAQAVAPVLVDSLVGRVSGGKPIIWLDARGALNTAVGGLLGGHPRFRGPLPDPAHTMWMQINRVTASGDTTRVVVEFGRDYADSGELTFWTEQRAYDFAREPKKSGWRFVRSRFIEHADGGWVRG